MTEPATRSPLLQSLWRYRWIVAAAPLLVAAPTYALADAQPRTYQAEATVFFVDPRGSGVLGSGGQPRVDTAAFVNQQVERARSRPVLERAAQIAEAPDLARLQEAVAVDGEPDLLAMRITATGRSAEAAAARANAVTDAFDEVVAERALADAELGVVELAGELADIQREVDVLVDQLAAAPGDPMLNARLQSLIQLQLQLEARQRELTVEAAAAGSGIDLVEPAIPPEAPSDPRPLLDALLAGLATAVLSGWAAHWHASRVRVVLNRLEPERILDVPLLGEVPRFDAAAIDAGELQPVVDEAVQFLRASVEFVLGDLGWPVSLAITSAVPGEGKTSLSLLLSRAMCDGREVALLDADLRASGLTRRLGCESRPGLTDLVTRNVPLDSCVHRPPGPPAAGVAFVPSGRRSEAPAAFLRSAAFGRRLAELGEAFDLVILDSPPLLAVADAVVVAAQADGVVLVVDHGARVADLERLRERLSIVPRPVLGYVYNRAPLRGSHYGYGYGYGTVEPAVEQSHDRGAARVWPLTGTWSVWLSQRRRESVNRRSNPV